MVECALIAYDKQKSVLNECLRESEASKESDGGLRCVLETLEACTQLVSTVDIFCGGSGEDGGFDAVF